MKKYIRAIEQVKKMSKHYCIFSAQYYPHVGGVERYTLYLSRKLIAAGNEVTIVTSNTGDLISVYILAKSEKQPLKTRIRNTIYESERKKEEKTLKIRQKDIRHW